MGKLIVHADDFGMNHDVNLAIKKGILEDIIDRTTLMVNMPYTEEAIELAKKYDFLSRVGLHINLVEGNPITCEIKDTWLCTNGKFNGAISEKKYKRAPINDPKVLKCLAKEIDAQMKLFKSWGMPLLHLDSHQHSHVKPSIFPIVYRLAKQNEFNSIRLAALIPSDKPSLTVRLYKSYLNFNINRFNNQKQAKDFFPVVEIGGAFLSIKNQTEMDGGTLLANNNVEMWFHPSLVNGEIINLYCNEPFSIQDINKLKLISTGSDK